MLIKHLVFRVHSFRIQDASRSPPRAEKSVCRRQGATDVSFVDISVVRKENSQGSFLFINHSNYLQNLMEVQGLEFRSTQHMHFRWAGPMNAARAWIFVCARRGLVTMPFRSTRPRESARACMFARHGRGFRTYNSRHRA